MGFSQWETNAPRVGNTVISVFGTSIGVYDASSRVRIAATSCLYTSWVSESQVSCQVPAGRGLQLPTVVTIGARKGTSSGAFSYNVPAVSMLVSATFFAETGERFFCIFCYVCYSLATGCLSCYVCHTLATGSWERPASRGSGAHKNRRLWRRSSTLYHDRHRKQLPCDQSLAGRSSGSHHVHQLSVELGFLHPLQLGLRLFVWL